MIPQDLILILGGRGVTNICLLVVKIVISELVGILRVKCLGPYGLYMHRYIGLRTQIGELSGLIYGKRPGAHGYATLEVFKKDDPRGGNLAYWGSLELIIAAGIEFAV